jgi:hypothetical protein
MLFTDCCRIRCKSQNNNKLLGQIKNNREFLKSSAGGLESRQNKRGPAHTRSAIRWSRKKELFRLLFLVTERKNIKISFRAGGARR